MQSLFPLGKGDHDETYPEDQPGQDLGKVSAGCIEETDALAIQIGDSETEHLLADRTLP